jgi:hypothetical protein
MRSHFLRDFRLAGVDAVLRESPEFDLYGLRQVTAIKWHASRAVEGAPELSVRFAGEGAAENRDGLEMHCTGVRQLKIPPLSPHFWVSELEIEDLFQAQLEGVRYRVRDFGGEFEVLCWDLAVGTFR